MLDLIHAEIRTCFNKSFSTHTDTPLNPMLFQALLEWATSTFEHLNFFPPVSLTYDSSNPHRYYPHQYHQPL